MKFKLFLLLCAWLPASPSVLPAAVTTMLPRAATPRPRSVRALHRTRDILNLIAPQLQKEGITLKVIEFSDYIWPNLAQRQGA